MHKTANVFNKLPKHGHPKAKAALQAIWLAVSRDEAKQAFDAFGAGFTAK